MAINRMHEGLYQGKGGQVKAYQVRQVTHIHDKRHDRTVEANPGEWVVTRHDGSVYVMSDEIFHEFHDPAE